MIKNIGSQLDKIQEYFEWIPALDIFEIYAGKPITQPDRLYLYFTLANNSIKIQDDSSWAIYKEALFDFVIVWNKKDIPDVELYEALDLLSTNITTFGKTKIELTDFEIFSIQEWAQSGVLRDVNDTPYLIAQYNFIYKYLY